MLRPFGLFLLLLLPPRGWVGSAALLPAAAAPGPLNSTEGPRVTVGNGTRTGPPQQPPSTSRPLAGSGLSPGSRLSPVSGLPVLKRAIYVLSALSLLAALYFLLRAFRPRTEGPRPERRTRSRLKKPQRKKYGLLANHDENIEMASLDSDEDTVFETRNLRR